jgi:protein arginine kinase
MRKRGVMGELSTVSGTAAWFGTAGVNGDVVIASSASLSRNLADYPYPAPVLVGGTPGVAESGESQEDTGKDPREDQAAQGPALERRDEEHEALRLVVETIRNELMPDVLDAETLEMDPATLSGDALGMLFERRLIAEAIPYRLFVSHDEAVTLAVGAVDHLKFTARVAGDSIEDALQRVRSIDRILEPHLNYAVSLDLGYLSAEITNLGTGLRTSVLLHLPALSASDRLAELAQSVAKSDFALVPDEQLNVSENEPVFYRLSNVRTLGLEEDAIAGKLEEHTRALVHYERVAREELVASQKQHLTDVACRSLGILRNARLLTADEALKLLGRLRFGIVANLVSGVAVETVTSLLFLTRDRHVRIAVQEKARSDDHGEENLQTARAQRVRSAV